MKEKINEDSRNTKKGCLMLKMQIKNWNDVLSFIDSNDIFDDEEHSYGLEKEPHITVLYGVSNTVSHNEVKEFIESNVTTPITGKLTSISMFENEYDVLKFTVDSEDLHKLNKLMTDSFPYENDYPDYIPHMTIAYLKKGTGKKYTKNIKPIEFKSKSFVYSIGFDDKIEWTNK